MSHRHGLQSPELMAVVSVVPKAAWSYSHADSRIIDWKVVSLTRWCVATSIATTGFSGLMPRFFCPVSSRSLSTGSVAVCVAFIRCAIKKFDSQRQATRRGAASYELCTRYDNGSWGPMYLFSLDTVGVGSRASKAHHRHAGGERLWYKSINQEANQAKGARDRGLLALIHKVLGYSPVRCALS